MHEKQPSARRVLSNKVFALVLMIPLLPSILSLPFPFGSAVSLACIVASIYGAWLAVRHGACKLASVATILTVLNALSLVFLSSPSVLMGLFYLAYVFGPSLIAFG